MGKEIRIYGLRNGCGLARIYLSYFVISDCLKLYMYNLIVPTTTYSEASIDRLS